MTLLTRANRDFLKKHARAVGDEFTIEHGYDIRTRIKGSHEGEPVVDESWKRRGPPEPSTHLGKLQRSGHIILVEEVSIKAFDERPPRKGAPPMHMQTGYAVRQTFRRRK